MMLSSKARTGFFCPDYKYCELQVCSLLKIKSHCPVRLTPIAYKELFWILVYGIYGIFGLYTTVLTNVFNDISLTYSLDNFIDDALVFAFMLVAVLSCILISLPCREFLFLCGVFCGPFGW